MLSRRTGLCPREVLARLGPPRHLGPAQPRRRLRTPRRCSSSSAEHFRLVMAHVPTSVAVVAAMVEASPHGLSVGTFVPVSLNPPLVGFFVANTSKSWPLDPRLGLVLRERPRSRPSRRLDTVRLERLRQVHRHRLASRFVGQSRARRCRRFRRLRRSDASSRPGTIASCWARCSTWGSRPGQAPLLHHRSSYQRVADERGLGRCAAEMTAPA